MHKAKIFSSYPWLIKYHPGSKTAPCDLPLVMRYGRRDCDGKPKEAPKMQSELKMGMMDAGTSVSGEGLLGWCDRVYKFTTRECVAVIGKYTSLAIVIRLSAVRKL